MADANAEIERLAELAGSRLATIEAMEATRDRIVFATTNSLDDAA